MLPDATVSTITIGNSSLVTYTQHCLYVGIVINVYDAKTYSHRLAMSSSSMAFYRHCIVSLPHMALLPTVIYWMRFHNCVWMNIFQTIPMSISLAAGRSYLLRLNYYTNDSIFKSQLNQNKNETHGNSNWLTMLKENGEFDLHSNYM